jgi:hypothetical protein
MDLGEWLKGLGLGQYEETFHEHEIDADVLPDLTEADLEKKVCRSAPVKADEGIASLASAEAPRSAEAPALPPEISARPASSRWTGRTPPDYRDVLRSVGRPISPRSSTLKTGATWSTLTSTRRRRP